jgi:hypothetical protein
MLIEDHSNAKRYQQKMDQDPVAMPRLAGSPREIRLSTTKRTSCRFPA